MSAKRQITAADIMPLEEYTARRKEIRAETIPMKKKRRVHVGPDLTFYFENFDTMLRQIQEMLYIEKGGDEQLADELAAYNPLIPQGRELVATAMFEIDDEARRARDLARLGHVEDSMFISVGGEKIYAVAEREVERTSEEGKTSSVHFLHFPFTDEQVAKFRDPANEVLVGAEHANYGHIAVMGRETREALAADFD